MAFGFSMIGSSGLNYEAPSWLLDSGQSMAGMTDWREKLPSPGGRGENDMVEVGSLVNVKQRDDVLVFQLLDQRCAAQL